MKLATSKTAAEDSGEGAPGVGEGCGGVYLILNLSEKGSLVYLTVKNIRICNGLSEGRNRRGERKEGRVGNLRK